MPAVANVNDLQNMNLDLTADYWLTGDIDATGTPAWNGGAGFIPVGAHGAGFSGTFDGQGFTINGLTINRPAIDYQGLFGETESAGVNPVIIQNVTLTNVSITGADYIGALVGEVEYHWPDSAAIRTIIRNCHSSGTVTGGIEVGGLIGEYCDLYIENCSSSCTINATTGGGGLIGGQDYNQQDIYILDCYATGAVNVEVFGGGLISRFASDWPASGYMDRCYATGAVTLNNPAGPIRGSGGFIGRVALNAGHIKNCWCSGNVTATGVGFPPGGSSSKIGGFVGDLTVGTALPPPDTDVVEDCYSTGNVSITDTGYRMMDTGAFVGSTGGEFTMRRCWCSGDITLNISNSHAWATGGFIGDALTYRIEDCYCTGAVSVTTAEYARNTGGFCGSWISSAAYPVSYLARCRATGGAVTVICGTVVEGTGGFAGQVSGAIYDCYATKNVTVTPTNAPPAMPNNNSLGIGGFIGGTPSTVGDPEGCYHCYCTGVVTVNFGGTDYDIYTGGFAGDLSNQMNLGMPPVYPNIVAEGCFWDMDTSGIAVDCGGRTADKFNSGSALVKAVGLHTSEITYSDPNTDTIKSVLEAAGWDFTVNTGVWKFGEVYSLEAASINPTSAIIKGKLINETGNDNYPYLAWEVMAASQCDFEYGVSENYGTLTARVALAAGEAFEITLTSLKPGTEYFFRARAEGSFIFGLPLSILTAPAPIVITLPATNIGEHEGQLNGHLLDDGGVGCQVYFEWGATTAYGGELAAGWATSPSDFNAMLVDLGPGSIVHYRAVAVNVFGIHYGNDMSFVTLLGEGPASGITGDQMYWYSEGNK